MTGKYQAYPEYKDSGVEWLGEVPSEWEVSRVKFFSTLNPSKSQLNDITLDTEVTFLPMEAIGEQGELDTSKVKLLKDVLNGYTYIGEGDVCIAKITPCFENGKGAVVKGLKNGIAFATTEVIPFRCFKEEDSKYLYYLLTSEPFTKIAEGSMYGAGGQKRVSDGFVGNYHFSEPPFNERTRIANFLDHETAKIDTLIEKQQQLIKLLKEKRQAVISHAVTKGLNPNAPMRDSGVEWLGEMPEHWEVVPLKHLANIKYGIGEPPKYTEEGVALVRATNIRSGRISNINLVFVNPDDIPINRIVWLEAGDIIVVRSGAGTGDSSIIPKEYEGSIAGFDMVVKPIKCMPTFLGYALLSNYVRDNQMDLEKARAAQPHLNAEELGDCFILLPPKKEQVEIDQYLVRKLSKFDLLMQQVDKASVLLQERRTALISAAVTGKIDVRNWQSSEPLHNTKEISKEEAA